MKKFFPTFYSLWRDESGQGAMEYILMLVVVGAIVIAFKNPILRWVGTLTEGSGEKLKKAIDNAGATI